MSADNVPAPLPQTFVNDLEPGGRVETAAQFDKDGNIDWQTSLTYLLAASNPSDASMVATFWSNTIKNSIAPETLDLSTPTSHSACAFNWQPLMAHPKKGRNYKIPGSVFSLQGFVQFRDENAPFTLPEYRNQLSRPTIVKHQDALIMVLGHNAPADDTAGVAAALDDARIEAVFQAKRSFAQDADAQRLCVILASGFAWRYDVYKRDDILPGGAPVSVEDIVHPFESEEPNAANTQIKKTVDEQQPVAETDGAPYLVFNDEAGRSAAAMKILRAEIEQMRDEFKAKIEALRGE